VKKCYNITKLRKKLRESKRRKPGRKQPRPHDEDHKEEAEPEPEPQPQPQPEQEPEPEQDDIIDLDMPPENDEALDRDVKYSCQVWVRHDQQKLSVDLNVTEREIIDGKQENGWLSDVIIDAAMELIMKNRNHKNIGIYQSCTCARLGP
jgi:hypothetical protein